MTTLKYPSNNSKIGDGIRATRVSGGGTKLEMGVGDRWSEVVPDVPDIAPSVSEIIALQFPDQFIFKKDDPTMPSYFTTSQLLDPAKGLYLKGFTVDVGGGPVAHTAPDWETDPTYEIDCNNGQIVFDQWGPYSIFQEGSGQANNPAAGLLTIGSITEITIARMVNGVEVVSAPIVPAGTPDIILSAAAGGTDVTPPFVVNHGPIGTNVSPSSTLQFIWSEPVARGAGKTLRIVDADTIGGALDVIETFDLDTAPTTGPGSVAIAGVSVTITPSAPMPDATRVATLMDIGAFVDGVGLSAPAVADDAYSFTIAAVAPPPPVSGDILMGADTAAGVKIHPAASLVDASGHFQLVLGFIQTTAAGAAAGFSGSPYSVTIDGQAATIAAVASGISVDSVAAAHAARNTMQASPSTDWTMILATGVDFAQGQTWAVTTAAMNGTYAHPDFNMTTYQCTADETNYTVDARTTCAGGSITVRPATDRGMKIACDYTVHSNSRLFFEHCHFEKQATLYQWFVSETGAAYNGVSLRNCPFRTIYQATLGSGAATPTGCCVYVDCDQGSMLSGGEAAFAVSYILTNSIGFVSFEGGKHDGFIIMANMSQCRGYNIEGIEVTRQIEDWMRCFTTKSSTTGGAYVGRRQVRNTAWKPLGQIAGDGGVGFLGFHADNIQDKTNADQVGIGGLVCDNLFDFRCDSANLTGQIDAFFDGTNGKPNFVGLNYGLKAKGNQGCIVGNTSNTIPRQTRFRRCIFLGNTANAFSGHFSDEIDAAELLGFHEFTFVDAKLANGWSTVAILNMKFPSQTSTIHNCACMKLGVVPAAATGMVVIANNIGNTLSPDRLFAGTDGNGGGFVLQSHTELGRTDTGVRMTNLDMSSVAAFRADIAARFVPQAGGALAGRSYLQN